MYTCTKLPDLPKPEMMLPFLKNNFKLNIKLQKLNKIKKKKMF